MKNRAGNLPATGVAAFDEWVAGLEPLSADRPPVGMETHPQNAFYGHADLLKRFCGLPPERPLCVAIPHGIRFDDSYGPADYPECFPVCLVPSHARVELLRQQLDRQFHAIGPMIHYAKPLLSAEDAAAVRARLGRTLLVFPTHSSHWVDTDVDQAAFLKQVAEWAEGFQTVLICVYWKDVLRGVVPAYRDAGFQCMTAGHMYDPLFLRRLRSLIELADVTAANNLGTHLGYAVHCGRPCWLQLVPVRRTAKQAFRRIGTVLGEPEYQAAFGAQDLHISPAQRELLETLWGSGAVRTPDEIRALLEEGERLAKPELFPRRAAPDGLISRLRRTLAGIWK